MPSSTPAPVTDEFGLVLSTSVEAARHYRRGVRQLLDGSTEALTSFARAVHADGHFALGHAGVAVVTSAAGDGDPRRALGHAAADARHISRRERQHVEVLAAALTGDAVRALVLARDHLTAFPEDIVVVDAVTRVVAGCGDEALLTELSALWKGVLPSGLDR
jgi:stage V sporulation protein SpoVS